MIPLAAAASLLALAAVAFALTPEAEGGALIDNTVVMLGVNDQGHLNYGSSGPSCSGTFTVGVRYMPTGCDATAAGCRCEAWGAAYGLIGAAPTVQGGASLDSGGIMGVTLISFSSTATTALSVTQIGDLKVTHDFHPDTRTDRLYQVKVTLENIGPDPMDNVTYRRTMDWDVEPTPFQEYSTIDTILPVPSVLQYSCTNGFTSGFIVSTPLSSSCPMTTWGGWAVGPPFAPPVIDVGPRDHGAAFDFNFGGLGSGNTREFNIYYGAGDNHTDAMNALDLISAQVWSLGKCGGGRPECTYPGGGPTPLDGGPNTFIFAFNGLTIPEPSMNWTYKFVETSPDNLTLDFVQYTDHIDFPPLDGLSVYRNWTFGDGAWGFERSPLHWYSKAGTYRVCETIVISRYGYVRTLGPMCKDVVVNNRPPDAAFEYEYNLAGTGIRPLDESTDRDGYVVDWQWDYGDGSGGDSRAQVHHLYFTSNVNPGYMVCLKVTDDNGATDSTCKPVKIRLGQARVDMDGDGVADDADTCAGAQNLDQADQDRDGSGDACMLASGAGDPNAPPSVLPHGLTDTSDFDLDGIADAQDNCVQVSNRDQRDLDRDGRGDLCDEDADGDRMPERSADPAAILDNCVGSPNPQQEDRDLDGTGDACDAADDVGIPEGAHALLSGNEARSSLGRDAEAAQDGSLGGFVRSPAFLGIAVAVVALSLLSVGLTGWALRRWK
jgi:hypothetical protein